jgi:hypothetical protein
MVFNPTKSDIDIEENPEWAPHSGNNMIVSFRNYEKDNDDWLISPKLSGEAQTISFYARAPKANSDKLIVYASTSDTETGSFTRLEEGRITLTTEWVKYTFELEAGTQYFAFRNSSTSGTAVMIDDIEYEAGASWAVEPVVESYNLYKDGVLVSNTTDNNITVDRVPGSYYVTVVYNVGESEASNIVEISTVGIEDIKADAINNDPIYDLYGRRVYNLQPGNIYISKGKKFIYKNL